MPLLDRSAAPEQAPLPVNPAQILEEARDQPAAKLSLGWILLVAILCGLWAPVLRELWAFSQEDPATSQAPLIGLIACGLLWSRRSDLHPMNAAAWPGLAVLVMAALVYVAAVWADIDFLKPLALLAVAAGGLWFLGGARAAGAAAGPLGLFLFMIPWPTTLTGSLAFPLQLISSAYAAQMAGMCGIPIQRDGVQLAVVPHTGAAPVYSIIVAQACSGLTSISVLLALGYLIAYFTPVRMTWRAALVAITVPMAVLFNAVRLTLVLIAGANHRPALAQWIHDHEQPVLIFLCSLCLLWLRHLLLQWQMRSSSQDDGLDTEGGLSAEHG